MSVKKRLEEPKTLYNCWTIEDADRLALISLIEVAEEVSVSPPEFDDERLGYVVRQTDRCVWDDFIEILKVVID